MPPAVTCVFCGAPIAPDEEMSGRPPHAAHARCADAALADDRHWDAVAAATAGGSGDPADQPADSQGTATAPAGGRGGCLGLVALGLIGAALAYRVAVGSDLLHRLDVLRVERQGR